MFKCPVIKVNELLLNEEKIDFENENSKMALQISLIESNKKMLKLSKISGETIIDYIKFPFDQLSNPKIDSTQLEFNVKGPVNFNMLNMNKNLKSFNIKINFDSEYNPDAKAFSSFFEYWNSHNIREKSIKNFDSLPRTPTSQTRMNESDMDFIKRIPNTRKKQGPFVKITNNVPVKKEDELKLNLDNIAETKSVNDQIYDEEPDLIIENSNFNGNVIVNSLNLTSDQERCWFKSSDILYGME